MKVMALALVVGLAWASEAAAQLKPGSPVFVVDLFNPLDPKTAVVSAASFNQALAKPGDQATPLSRVVDACADPASTDAILDQLHTCADCLRAYQEKRFITERGDQTLLIVLFDANVSGDNIRPFFQETPRDSELVATAKALRKLVDVGLETRAVACRAFPYTLQRKRSLMKVTVPIPPELIEHQRQVESRAAAAAPPAPAAAVDPVAAAKAKLLGKPSAPPAPAPAPSDASAPAATVETAEVTLGPVERWFLSADFSFSAASVKLGGSPAPEDEALQSKDFFVALNFAVSDLLADRASPLQKRAIWNELVLKVQVTPSREPWTAWAVGVGVRGYRVRTILWNMDVVHPYVAFGRQEMEGEEARWRAVFGLGFDPRSINRSGGS